MSKSIKIVGAVLAVVVTVSLVSVMAVSADARTGGRMGGMGRWGEAPGNGIVEGLRDRLGEHMGGRMGGFMGASDGLAEALGLTQEELRDAFAEGKTIADLAEEQGLTLDELWETVHDINEEAHREAIQERVADGEITQEQADWILEGMDSEWEMGMRNVRPMRSETNPMEAAAEELGLTIQELRVQMWGGATLEELFDEAGLDWDAYQADLQAAAETSLRDAIAQAVSDGDISAEQADWLIRGLDAGYLAGPEAGFGAGPGTGGPRGGMRGESKGRGGMRGGGRFAPEQTLDTDAA